MAKRIRQIQSDFLDVLDFFTSKGIITSDPEPSIVPTAKRIHRLTYSLIWWRFRFSRGPQNQKVFLHELASDALQVLPQALMGYQKTTMFLVRGIVEHVIRHVYYSDHPIEFQRINLEKRWYIPIADHFTYLKTHPLYANIEKKFDAVGRLKNLHQELSLFVHGMKISHMEMRPGLRKIKLNQLIFARQADFIRRAAESSNFILAVFHKTGLLKLHPDDQKVVLLTFPPKARRVLAGLS